MEKLVLKIGLDKIAHFGVGGLLTAWFWCVMALQDMERVDWGLMLWACAATVAAGVLMLMKEMVDGRWCRGDVVAGLLGALMFDAAVVAGILLHGWSV